jgi:hypothetical protein
MRSFFYMLYVEGGGAPTKKHEGDDAEASAKREAERLARLTGQRVHVLRSVASCIKNDVQWRSADPAERPADEDGEIPF